MAKVKINSKGIEQVAGSGLDVTKTTTNAGFGPYGQSGVTNVTSTSTLTKGMAGVLVVSGDAIVTGTLPTVNGAYGAMLTIRCGSAHAHVLSSSLDTQDNTNICDATNHGNKLVMPAVVGSSAVLLADGVSWIVLGNSGSYSIA